MAVKNLGQLGFLLLLVLVFLSGCGEAHLGLYSYTHYPSVQTGAGVYPVYVDNTFGASDRIGIAEAIDQWNYALNGNAKLVIVDTHFDMQPSVLQQVVSRDAFLILKITTSNSLTKRADEMTGPGSWALGFTPFIGSHYVYLIRDRIHDNDAIKYLVMHELGHALGAVHTAHGLMSPAYNKLQFQCVDRTTVIQVAAYQHWNVDTFNYCRMAGFN